MKTKRYNEIENPKGSILPDLIEKAFYRMGQSNVSAPVLAMAVQETHEIIRDKYSHFTEEQIELVFRMGSLGELTDDVHVCAKTINNWFKDFDANVRPHLPVDESKMIEAPKKEIPKLTEQAKIDFLFLSHENYKALGYVLPGTHRTLVKFGHLDESQYPINDYISRAEAKLKAEKFMTRRPKIDQDSIEIEASCLAVEQFYKDLYGT